MKILAIDPATTCGWALGDSTLNTPAGVIASGTWDLSVRRDESGGMRLVRLQNKMGEFGYSNHKLDFVVFEAARHAGAKMQGALVCQAEIQGAIKLYCEWQEIEYRGYSPSEIKKHATGKGNASKEMMMAAARERWHIGDDNEADALWLLDLAMTDLSRAAAPAGGTT